MKVKLRTYSDVQLRSSKTNLPFDKDGQTLLEAWVDDGETIVVNIVN
jgi:hypothetical protein